MSVNTYLTDLSSKLVLKGIEKEGIRTSINTLQTRLNRYLSNIEEHFIFGSYIRGTILPRRADEKSDIDYMVVFNNSGGYKPQTFLNYLKNYAEYYYSSSEIKQSYPTIVLELNHIKFELVPAYKVSYFGLLLEYKIPAPNNIFEEWIVTDPNGFNENLTAKNNNNNSKIKPAIRLIKYWNALNGYVYPSFELEKKIIANYYISCTSTKDYFISAIDCLPDYDFTISQAKRDKIKKLKRDVREIYDKDSYGYPITAENKIKKLIPLP